MIKQNNHTKSLEKIFDTALNLWEEGRTRQEILDMFPDFQKELQELFSTAEIIKKEKSEIFPSKEI